VATAARAVRPIGAVLCRLWSRRLEGRTGKAGRPEASSARCDPARADRVRRGDESALSVRGVIRREEVLLLARYGTSYGLFDESTAGYECVLKSDAYRLAEYVGDRVEVAGTLTDGVGGMPVMDVTRLQLLGMKWMR